ncbi:WG repeat-containing protein [Olivibacter sitiensis]|uniref:WG repeat-containing protein n=1 Tax=Olivibacter sitiensis TaxID=376470 RepID=UPI0004896E53|nr:WG repeat-containing protein [Olivibacter sitiensis]
MRYIAIILLFLQATVCLPQEEQNVQSIAFGAHLSPLVKIKKDGQNYYYHLDGKHWIDKVEERAGGLSVVIQNGYYGVLKNDGTLIVPFEYDRIKLETKYEGQWREGIDYTYRTIILHKDGKVGVANENGKITVPLQFQDAKAINGRAVAIAEGKLWGWASLEDGEILHPPKYEYVRDFVSDDFVEIRDGDKGGVARTNGEVVVPVEYDRYMRYLKTEHQTFFIGYKEEKAFLLDTSGHVLLSGHDQYTSAHQQNLIFFKENNRYGLFDLASNQALIAPTYEAIETFTRGIAIVKKDGKFGTIDTQGAPQLPAEFDKVSLLSASGGFKTGSSPTIFAPPQVQNEKVTEELMRRREYEAEIEERPYLIEVTKGNSTGIYNNDQQPIVPLGKYDRVSPHYYKGNTLYLVSSTQRMGILDEEGKEILPVKYEHDRPYKFSRKAVDQQFDVRDRFISFMAGKGDNSLGEKIGLFDLAQKKIIIPPDDQYIDVLNDRLIKVRKRKDYKTETSIYDLELGKETPLAEDVIDAMLVGDVFLLLESKDLYQLADPEGRIIYENTDWKTRGSYLLVRFPKMNDLPHGHFYHGLKKIYATEGNLFIDETGKEIRFEGFDQVDDFYEGFAIGAKEVDDPQSSRPRYIYGMIDRQGKTVLPFEFDLVERTGGQDDLLQFRKGDLTGLFRRDGSAVLDAQYNYISYSEDYPYITIQQGGKYGLADKSGIIKVEPIYDRIDRNFEGKEKTWPIIAKEGEWYYFVGEDGKRYPMKAKEKHY